MKILEHVNILNTENKNKELGLGFSGTKFANTSHILAAQSHDRYFADGRRFESDLCLLKWKDYFQKKRKTEKGRKEGKVRTAMSFHFKV